MKPKTSKRKDSVFVEHANKGTGLSVYLCEPRATVVKSQMKR